MGFANGFKGVLKTMYPMLSLAASMGGPVGTMAAASIGKALGIDKVEPTHDGIEAAVIKAQETNPDALLKLKEAEADFILKCKGADIDLAKMEFEDTSNARAMHVSLRDFTPQILSYVLVGGAFILSWVVLLHKISVDNAMAGVILGYVFSESKQAISFWLGSSAASKGKDDTINELSKG